MLLKNEGACDLIHETYRLAVGKTLDVPESIAQLWLCYRGISEVKPIIKEDEIQSTVKERVATAPKPARKRIAKK